MSASASAPEWIDPNSYDWFQHVKDDMKNISELDVPHTERAKMYEEIHNACNILCKACSVKIESGNLTSNPLPFSTVPSVGVLEAVRRLIPNSTIEKLNWAIENLKFLSVNGAYYQEQRTI